MPATRAFAIMMCMAGLGACGDGDSADAMAADAGGEAGGEGGGGGAGGAGGAGPMLPEGCDVHLEPGEGDQERVQTTLIEIAEGQTLCFAEGTFHFDAELSLAVNGVTLRGAGREATIFDFDGQNVGANGLLITSDAVTLTQFTVQETPGDGIRANDVDGIVFRDVAVLWAAQASDESGAYGLYPVESRNVVIDRCLVAGARDAGIYVGQSSGIVVRDSEAHGNVAGIEIENSTDAEVFGNYAHDNAGGLLVFNLPSLPVQNGGRVNVHDNRVENNNGVNFGAPGSVVAIVPPGTGILVLASDDNEIHHNTVTGNHGVGVALVSYIAALFGEYDDPNFNAYPVGNHIHDNTFESNGDMPAGLLEALPVGRPFPDLLWDGCNEEGVDAMAPENRNCFHDNAGADFVDADFCHGFMGLSTDVSRVECTHAPLPSQGE
jgi:parallel beta-helix repeat protein